MKVRQAARTDSEQGARIAVWQTGHEGLAWLDELVEKGQAIDLGGNGYPFYYTARADFLIPKVMGGPPGANKVWVCGPDDILTDKWEGRTVIDHDAAEACRTDEWLLVKAWDES